MQATLAHQLDALATWRRGLDKRTAEWAQHLKTFELDADGEAAVLLDAVRQRIKSDRLHVAFVAEFSRGKSELINAIFFADTGRRVLPATPGRTTMCPVEIGYDAAAPSQLALLPIETRLEEMTLAEWRERAERWTRIRLEAQTPAKLTEVLNEVMRTKAVTIDMARQLGLWDDARPDDNPPRVGEGLVEVPAWRHAAINYPHPLLQRGLVVLDTPGLNAIGAEPELTLSLLPSAHAIVFILGADTGVTKSDLHVWRDHLSSPAMTRLVALNKIDTLADPLLTPAEIDLQIESQRQATAQQLGIDAAQVFPVSARQALTARIDGRREMLECSRLLALEQALGQELLPRRHALLKQAVLDVVDAVERGASRRVQDQRVQLADQLHELKGLRGKSSGKASLMVQRVKAEAEDFERGAQKVVAVRSIHVRMLRSQLVALASASLRDDLVAMKATAQSSWLRLGARKAYTELFEQLHARVNTARQQGLEAHEMLAVSFRQLNAEHGFALHLLPPPDLDQCERELRQLESNYGQYLGITNAVKLGDKRFMDQFYRMLMSKLRVAFESASSDIELWHKGASNQLDSQLRDRRQAFVRRQESLERIVGAQGDLESRISELENQERRLQTMAAQTQTMAEKLRLAAREQPSEITAAAAAPPASGDAMLESTSPMGFDVRPHVPAGLYVESHAGVAVQVDTKQVDTGSVDTKRVHYEAALAD